MTKRFIREAHAKNSAVEPWTVNDPELLKQYIACRPDLMIEVLGKSAYRQ